MAQLRSEAENESDRRDNDEKPCTHVCNCSAQNQLDCKYAREQLQAMFHSDDTDASSDTSEEGHYLSPN